MRRVPRDEGSEAPPGVELVEVRVGDRPLEPERVYTVATNSFLAAGGDGYTVLAAAAARRHDPILLRELLEEHFRAGSPVTPPSDQRYTVLE